MCGIAGIFTTYNSITDKTVNTVGNMLKSIRHRGPDGQGIWKSPCNTICLGHRRLSIIDPSDTGKQPMLSKDGLLAIVFNGEIYNYIEIRRELEKRGHVFVGKSDTEVLIEAISAWGIESALKKTIGMFALAAWDLENKRLVLARDRVGKKPLYYYNRHGEICFASEIKAFKLKTLTLNKEAIYHYLSLGYIPSPLTIYNEVREVPAGCWQQFDKNFRCSVNYFWRYKNNQLNRLPMKEVVEETDALLTSAVKMRLRSDVPVGVFLSGGIDSGLVTALAAGQHSKPISTFTVKFDDSSYNEAPLARLIANRFATEHHEIKVTLDLDDLLPRIVDAYDEPFADPSAIPTYAIAEETSKYVKVVLNGDGSDEIFAGYRRHLAIQFYSTFFKLLSLVPEGTFRILCKALPTPTIERTGYSFFYRFLRGLNEPTYRRYMTWGTDSFNEVEKHSFFINTQRYPDTAKQLAIAMSFLNDNDPFKLFLAIDFISMLKDCLLVKMDIATMAHGLEARSPFLDHRLVEWTNHLHRKTILNGMRTKPILRELAKRYLPQKIVSAPKRGFEIPLTHWMKNKFIHTVHDLCRDSNGIIRELFDKNYIKTLIKNRDGMDDEQWAKKMWIIMMLGLWGQRN